VITIDGKQYPTLQEAAKFFGVSTKTVRGYLNRGIIPPAPTIEFGLREIAIFPAEYLSEAKRARDQYLADRKNSHWILSVLVL
jgi:DNA-binding transcriptional MerR regulator